MRVPEYIRKKMRYVAVYSLAIESNMKDIEAWLEKVGFDIEKDGLRDGGGCSLEELEYGNDISEELCERIEQLSRRKGR